MANNRRRGHRFERFIRKILEEVFGCDVSTSRYASKKTDDAGIDFVIDCQENLEIQTKTLCIKTKGKTISLLPFLKLEKNNRIYIIRLTEKRTKRFITTADVVIMDLELFKKHFKP